MKRAFALIALFLALFCTNTGSQSYIRLFMRGGSGGISVNTETLPPLDNLWAWYRADSLSLADGATVTVWTDSSGNGRNVGNGNTPTFELNEQNGKPGIKLDSGDNFSLADSPGTTVYSVYLVFRLNAATGTETIFSYGSQFGTAFNFQKGVGNRRVNISDSGVSQTDGAATTSTELWSVVKTSAPLTRLWVNGFEETLTNPDGVPLGTPEANLNIGNNTGFNPMAGFVFEILIYNVAHGDVPRLNAQNYLSSKWGTP